VILPTDPKEAENCAEFETVLTDEFGARLSTKAATASAADTTPTTPETTTPTTTLDTAAQTTSSSGVNMLAVQIAVPIVGGLALMACLVAGVIVVVGIVIFKRKYRTMKYSLQDLTSTNAVCFSKMMINFANYIL